MKIFLDGKLVDEKNAKISVFDHGLLYGDGVFEGIRAYNNRIFKLGEHIDRLLLSAKALLLEIPMTRQELIDATVRTCKANKIRDGYIRLVVTRGVGNLGLSPWNCKRPSVFIIADKIQLYPPAYYEKGMSIVTVPTRRMNPAALSPEVKSLNYLNNIMAKIEAKIAGCEEAVMLNDQGYVAECTGDNIFIFKGGKMFSPQTAVGALRGITRQTVYELAEGLGYEISEPMLTRYDLWSADEMFLTGTGAEIVPVTSVDLRKIGNGKVGPGTRKFIAAYRDLTRSKGEPIR